MAKVIWLASTTKLTWDAHLQAYRDDKGRWWSETPVVFGRLQREPVEAMVGAKRYFGAKLCERIN